MNEDGKDCSKKSWTLDRYARFIKSATTNGGNWKQYDDSLTPIYLVIMNHQLLLIQGTAVLESFNLTMSGSTLCGLAKTDSLLIMHKSKDHTRRCRVRFKAQPTKSAPQVCEECIQELSHFFMIKHSVPTNDPSLMKGQDKDKKKTHPVPPVMEEVTLGQMAQNILTDNYPSAAYQPDTNASFKFKLGANASASSDSFNHLVHLCLLDPYFPSFVSAVEEALKSATQPSSL